MTEQTLVVLGGADGALPTLAAAHRLGLRTLCVDQRPESPGVHAADEALIVSTRDVDEIASRLSGRCDLAGVVSPASDVNVPSQAALAARLDLPCDLTPAAVRASTNKAYVRRLVDELGMPGPRHVAGRAVDVVARAVDLRWPVMVKPIDLGGGRGVVRCDTPVLLVEAVAAAAEWSPTGQVIVEEFVAGSDHGLEAVIDGGEVRILGLTTREIGLPPACATIGHSMGGTPRTLVDQARTAITQLCDAIGYRRGFLNVDVIWTGRELVVIELGTRIGGNGIGELLGVVHGIDSTELYVRLATDPMEQVPTLEPCGFGASRGFAARQAGTLVSLSGVADARSVPGVVDVLVAARPGDHVEPYTQCRNKIALIIAGGARREDAAAALSAAEARLVVDVEPLDDAALDAEIAALEGLADGDLAGELTS